jgi:hypothetical protein
VTLPVEHIQNRAADGRREREKAIVVRLTSVEVRVMLAALNTALNRPALFRPPVMAMAEELSMRLIQSLRALKSDASDDSLAISDWSAPDELPPRGHSVCPAAATIREARSAALAQPPPPVVRTCHK